MNWIASLLVTLGVLIGLWLLLIALLWLHRPSRELVMPALQLLPDVVRLLRSVVSDPMTPRSLRWALIGAAAWIASPIDLLPEFLPVIGPLDDVLVAVLVLRWAFRRLGTANLREHWPGTDEGFGLLQRLIGL
jgi:Uncharacterized conserved protein